MLVTHQPKVPNDTSLQCSEVALLRLTFNRPMSLTTGAEIVVMMSSTAAASKKNVPIWWKNPVTAMSSMREDFLCIVEDV